MSGRLQNALLVEPNDVQRLARSIEQLAKDSFLAKADGSGGTKDGKRTLFIRKTCAGTDEVIRVG
jgi:hypothetical protein